MLIWPRGRSFRCVVAVAMVRSCAFVRGVVQVGRVERLWWVDLQVFKTPPPHAQASLMLCTHALPHSSGLVRPHEGAEGSGRAGPRIVIYSAPVGIVRLARKG